jgi:hypothetical protein
MRFDNQFDNGMQMLLPKSLEIYQLKEEKEILIYGDRYNIGLFSQFPMKTGPGFALELSLCFHQ